MIPMQGKFNNAKIMTDFVDNSTMSQVLDLCNEKTFEDSNIVIMPDCHAGKGCTIGTTMTISDKVVPNLVGVDIGCGVASFTISGKFDLDKVDNIIRTHIPHGFTTHERSREKLLREYFKIDLTTLKCKDNIQYQRAFYSLGTLGGGNHFIEINENDKGLQTLVVHTGSRNLGKQVADYYQEQAIKHCIKKYGRDLTSHIVADLKAKGQEHLIEQTIKEHKISNKKPMDNLCYLEGELMENYLHDMELVQRYSAANRKTIIADILSRCEFLADNNFKAYLKLMEQSSEYIECIHNYIDMDGMILRKGAISAKQGEKVIIPINMRDGIIIGEGKGSKEWNYSAPHGAGRILSRGQAKEQILLEDFKDSMKDIYTTCVGQSTLDEAPQAYKPIEAIIDNIDDTVDIIDIIKPIYNFKSN